MNLWWRAGLFLLIVFVRPAFGSELVLTQGEIDRLGITLAVPQASRVATVVSGRGRVVIPPAKDVAVSAAQPGLVVRLLAATGDRVTKGDLLAEINSAAFLEAQRAFLDAISADQLARSALARDQQLVAEGISSRRRLEQTEAAAAVAAAAVDEHRQLLQIGGLDAVAIDRLVRTRQLLPFLPVKAPIDGVVLALLAQVGAGIETTDALFRIGDLSTLWLELKVRQQQLAAVAEGMSVTAERGSPRIGQVLSISSTVDPQTQLVSVRVLIDPAVEGLRPGQFVAAEINGIAAGDQESLAWAIPLSSLVQVGERQYVFVRSVAGFEVVPVRQVGATADSVLVAGELDGGIAVADDGVAALKALWGGPTDQDH